MLCKSWRPVIAALGACIYLSAAACSATEHSQTPPRRAVHPQTSNPAARKCLEDGYRLRPVLKDGLPIDHLCVDKASGKQCEVWEYYRGKCRLREKAPRR